MTDQISFLPMPEPRDTSFEDNERKASQICDEEFERADGDIVKYVAACVDRFNKELPFPYDLRDDDRLKNKDNYGKVMAYQRWLMDEKGYWSDSDEYLERFLRVYFGENLLVNGRKA